MSKNIQNVLKILNDETKGKIENALKLMDPKYSMTWVYKGYDGKLFPCTGKDIRKEMEKAYKIKERKYEIINVAEEKNVVMVEMVESYPDPKTKKVYRTPQVIVLEMKNGKIKKGRHYCDPRLSLLFLTQAQVRKIFK